MNDFFDVLRARRSVRSYSDAIPEEQLQQFPELAYMGLISHREGVNEAVFPA